MSQSTDNDRVYSQRLIGDILSFCAVSIGTGLTVVSVPELIVRGLATWQIYIIPTSLGIGLLALGFATKRFRLLDLSWPEWILLLCIACVIPLSWSGQRSYLNNVYIPVPADKLVGGIDVLSPGQLVEIVAFSSSPEKTSLPLSFPNIEVREVSQGDAKIALLSVPPAYVADLQAALVQKQMLLTYRILPGTTTPTPSPTNIPLGNTATPTVPVTATALPPNGEVYLALPIRRLYSSPRGLRLLEKARLILAEDVIVATVSATPVLTHSSYQACVAVISYLNEQDIRQTDFDPQTTAQLLLLLPSDQLADVVIRLDTVNHVWLVTDPACKRP